MTTIKERRETGWAPPHLKLLTLVWLWIVVMNMIMLEMSGWLGGIHVSSWPLFLIPVFFFVQGADPTKIKEIFVGGCMGIILAFLLFYCAGLLTASVGSFWATMIPLIPILFLVIVVGPILPTFFNQQTFAFLIVFFVEALYQMKLVPMAMVLQGVTDEGAIMAALSSEIVSLTIMLLIVAIVGGAVVMGGIMLISKLVLSSFAKKHGGLPEGH